MQQEFSHERASKLISLLIASTNPNLTPQQAEVTANTITSAFQVSPKSIQGAKTSKKKSNRNTPRKTGETRPYFSVVEQNESQNQPISVSVNTGSNGYGCSITQHNGYTTLNMTRKQAKALRYSLHSFLQEQQSQQQGSSSWNQKVQQVIQNQESNAAVA